MASNFDDISTFPEDNQIITILNQWTPRFFSERLPGDDILRSEILNSIKHIASYYSGINDFSRQSFHNILTESQPVLNKYVNQPDLQCLEQVRNLFYNVVKFYFPTLSY